MDSRWRIVSNMIELDRFHVFMVMYKKYLPWCETVCMNYTKIMSSGRALRELEWVGGGGGGGTGRPGCVVMPLLFRLEPPLG